MYKESLPCVGTSLSSVAQGKAKTLPRELLFQWAMLDNK